MGFYDRYLLAPAINRMCAMPEVMAVRAEVVPQARGDVLELGMGSGLNIELYDSAQVRRLVGVDPGRHITALARERMEQAPIQVVLLRHSGEAIPLDDRSFDTVVMTFTLCSIPDLYSALGEVRRLLKPGGELLFAEHGLAPDPGVQRWQRRVNPLWKALAGGCHLTRDVVRLLEDGGFRLLPGVRANYAMTGPRIVTWVSRGAAVVR